MKLYGIYWEYSLPSPRISAWAAKLFLSKEQAEETAKSYTRVESEYQICEFDFDASNFDLLQIAAEKTCVE